MRIERPKRDEQPIENDQPEQNAERQVHHPKGLLEYFTHITPPIEA